MVMGSESLLCRRHTVHDSQYGIDIDLQTVGHEQRHAGIFHQFSDVSMGDQAVMDAFAGYVLAEKALDYADAVYYGYLFCGSRPFVMPLTFCDAVAVADIYAAGVFSLPLTMRRRTVFIFWGWSRISRRFSPGCVVLFTGFR